MSIQHHQNKKNKNLNALQRAVVHHKLNVIQTGLVSQPRKQLTKQLKPWRIELKHVKHREKLRKELLELTLNSKRRRKNLIIERTCSRLRNKSIKHRKDYKKLRMKEFRNKQLMQQPRAHLTKLKPFLRRLMITKTKQN